MRARCAAAHRLFPAALDGALSGRRADRLEAHLGRCPACRGLFTRVRAGHEAGRRFGRLAVPEPPPSLDGRVLAGVGDAETGRRPAVLKIAVAAAAAGLVLFALLRPARRGGPGHGGFAPRAIGDFASNGRGRVFTEGFVHDVYFDEQERTLHIKLLESPHRAEPFVICEVREPGRMAIPPEGSRVRVYGSARFDGQPGRGWHEVNPVERIAVLEK